MTCEFVQSVIEEVAAGERPLDPAIEAHLAGCPACAAALTLARRIESALAVRPQPEPPAGFARATAARVRRERWREEERFDRAFNVGLGIGGVLILGGVVAALNLSGLAAVLRDASSVLAEGANAAMGRVSSGPSILVGIALLLAGAFAWWWAEERYSW